MHKKNSISIPALLRWILWIILPDPDRDTLCGDFTEIYLYILNEKGRLKADLWLWGHIIKSAPGFFRDSIHGSFDMIKNYFTKEYSDNAL